MTRTRTIGLLVVVLLAALSRFLPHPPNFTPIIAMGLFGGAYFSDRRLAFGALFAAMLLSDIFIGFHPTMPYTYGALALVVLLGGKMSASRTSFVPVMGFSFGAALLFFVISNFGVWHLRGFYPQTAEGLALCFTMALPFLKYTVGSTMIYSALLFGGFEFSEKRIPALAAPALA